MDETTRERLRALTVEVLLDLRAEYLASGASPLKHWTQLQDRMRAAARTTTSVPGWVTALARSLGLGAPTRARSGSTLALQEAVTEAARPSRWLDLVEEEHAYLIALARLRAEQRKEQRGDEEPGAGGTAA